MPPARSHGVLTLLVALLGGLLLGTPSAASSAPGAETYDAKVGKTECRLLGRAFRSGQGCSRTRCVEGATPFRKVYGAEACALKGQPKGFGFVSTVDVRQCRALRRHWIAEVNYCASQPDRSLDVEYDAPQCTGTASVYVPLQEVEGHYDECLTPGRVQQLNDLAIAEGTTLAQQVAMRSYEQCSHRPQSRWVDARCVQDPALVPAGGGTLVVGDSITWRGGDELTRRQRDWTIDAEPARPATELAARLDAFRAVHGQPDDLVVELGTVPSPGFRQRDLRAVLRSLPATTRVMLVLPHYEVRTEAVVVSPQSERVGAWMRAAAKARARTCTADWPAYVAQHRGILQDGVHPTRAAEGQWSRWLVRAWKGCR